MRELEAALGDLPLRLLWGGAGALMTGSIERVRDKSLSSWRQSAA